MDISVIIPLYNEEESLPELHAWIQRVMNANGFTYEINIYQMTALKIGAGMLLRIYIIKMRNMFML